MSVMESMRSGTDSTFMQVILIAVVVSFVMWGVGPQGDQAGTVVEVNGERVADVDFNRQLALALQNMERRRGEPASNDEVAQIREDLRQQTIRQVALRQEAEAMGLVVSDKEVLRSVMQQDAFKDDESGMFDEQRYERILRLQGLTVSKFEAQQREALLLNKLVTLVSYGVSVNGPMVEKKYLEENTKVVLDMVRIRPGAFSAAYEPTQEEVDAFLADSMPDVQAQYDADFAERYELGERVTLRMLKLRVTDDGLTSLDLEKRMLKIQDELAGGASFDEMARTYSDDRSASEGGLLAEVEVSRLDEAVQNAITGVETGEMAEVIVQTTDLRLYMVEARTPAETKSIDDVKGDIARDLLIKRAGPERAASFAENDLLPAWQASGGDVAPEDLLVANGLSVVTTDEIALTGAGGGLFPPPVDMVKAAAKATPGTLLDEVFTDDQGTLFVGRLVSITEANLDDLEGEREEYTERTLAIARRDFTNAYFDDVVARATIR